MAETPQYKQGLKSTVKTTKFMLGFVWKEAQGKLYLILKGVTALLNAVFPLVFVILPGLIINELSGAKRLNTLILYVGLLAVLPVVHKIIDASADKRIYKLQLALDLNRDAMFFARSADMDYETLENPEITVMKTRANNALGKMFNVADQMSNLISAVVSMLAMSSIILTLNPLLIVLVLCVTYINSLYTKRLNKKQFILGKELSRSDNHMWTFYWTFEQFDYAKEIRLFDLKSLLIGMFKDSKEKHNKKEVELHATRNAFDVFTAVTNMLQQIGLYAYMIFRVVARGLALGSMTIYMSAATQFSSSLGRIFNAYLALSRTGLDIQELIEFLSIPSKHKPGGLTPSFDKSSVIEFKNVSFKYPGSENYALRNLDLTIRGDEKLCIVGVNGSGKSTFIKLLTRLYVPTEGEILLNGVNAAEYDHKQYQRLFAPVFQDFQKYYLTLGQNITLASEYDAARLGEVCEKSGLTPLVEKLPKGLDTQVEKTIDEEGFIPSGGENQRIAIARALYHGAPFYLLDEPTAALDPLAEYEIYTQFSEMIEDKAAILITHRLSAVQLADKVALFDNGSLAEYGTHKQLYDKGAMYAEMFDKQAEFYIDKAEAEAEAV